MNARRAALWTPLLAACWLGGCGPAGEGGGTGATDSPAVARHIVEREWRAAFEVGGALEDTLLLRPAWLAADHDGISLIDTHGARVVRFDHAGQHRWTFGRRGGGPDEFRQPRAVKTDRHARTWVLDISNLRITVLEPDGTVRARIPIYSRELLPRDLVPLEGDRAVLVLGAQVDPLAVIDFDGQILWRGPLWEDVSGLHPLLAQLGTAHDAASGHWLAARLSMDGFAVYRDTTWLGYRGRYVGPIEPPSVVQEREPDGSLTTRLEGADAFVLDVAIDGGRIFVQSGHIEPYGSRLLDVFEVETGRYIESLVLPHGPLKFAVHGDRIYAVYWTPAPMLVAWEPAGQAPASRR